jgi:hypothetical protein
MMWRGTAAAAFLAVLLISCTRKPDAPPAVARPAAIGEDAGNPAGASTILDPCAVVATVLTEPGPGQGGLSAIERPEAARAKQSDGRLVVALSLVGEKGAPSLLPASVDCGDRLIVVSAKGTGSAGVEPIALRLSPEGDSAFGYALTLGPPGTPLAPTQGRLVRDDTGEWRVAGPSRKVPRLLDATPVERVLPEAMPAGQASAWLELDTGGDTLSVRSLETGLVLVVRLGARELRQVFASCPEGAKGSALGDLERDVLDRAACGDVYRLVRKESAAVRTRSGQQLVVDKQLPNGDWLPAITLDLPPDIRTVSSPSLERSRSHGG